MNVRIYKPAKTAMQSGRAKTHEWQMQFDESAAKFVEPLMGWVGQKDTTQQLHLSFDSKEAAIAYAEKQGYRYRIIEPKERKVIPKSYADNFRHDKVTH